MPAGALYARGGAFAAVAAFGCLLDLVTKHWVFHGMGPPARGNVHWLIPNFVGIEPSLNPGALFGLGAGFAHLFAVISIVAFLGILYWLFVAGAARDWWLTLSLACISAGIFGNLYDRLALWSPPWDPGTRIHEVRDWILFCYHDWKWPNFNIADSFLVCGAASLMVHAFRRGDTAAKTGQPGVTHA